MYPFTLIGIHDSLRLLYKLQIFFLVLNYTQLRGCTKLYVFNYSTSLTTPFSSWPVPRLLDSEYIQLKAHLKMNLLLMSTDDKAEIKCLQFWTYVTHTV